MPVAPLRMNWRQPGEETCCLVKSSAPFGGKDDLDESVAAVRLEAAGFMAESGRVWHSLKDGKKGRQILRRIRNESRGVKGES